MIKNYFKVAWRNLTRNKTFSLINVLGLAIGMACTMLIALWVYNEKNWDGYHKKYDSVYQLYVNRNFNGEISTGPDLMYPLVSAIQATHPEVQHAVTVSFPGSTLMGNGETRINKTTLTVSPDFFDIFTFDFIRGNKEVLKDPDAIVMTESTAKAVFGSTDVLGQQVRLNNNRNAVVKAILKDVPRNSTVQFDGLIPFNPSSPEIKEAESEWVNCSYQVFLDVKPGTGVSSLESNLINLIRKRTNGENPTTRGSVLLHPMEKWRLFEEFRGGKNTGGRIQYVNLFTWVAVVILIIACVNFMNLSTARSEKRAREVGIRKTLGSGKKQLIAQFLSESVLLALISFLVATAVVYAAMPSFTKLLNIEVIIPYSEPAMWAIVLGIILLTGFVAGGYPAFYLSDFMPVKVLKGTILQGKQAVLPRKILVTSQFIAAIVLISATLIIYQQLQHVKKRDIGYDTNNLIQVKANKDLTKNYDAFRNELQQSGVLSSVVRTSSPLTTILGFTSGIRWQGADPNTQLIIGFLFSNNDFTKTLNAKLIDGRDFCDGDSNTVIFNKEAIRLMGLESPVGREITWAGRQRTIVGVVDNMVMTSPYEAASPMMVAYDNKWSGFANIRLNEGVDVRKSLSLIEAAYKKFSPEYPFEFRFIDDEFNQKFLNEQLIGKLAVIFAGLSIFVCCLGLFGLVSFTIERRTKEIGIRKVLGASVQQVLVLMSREFLILVGLAFLVAIPAAWWAMNEWLKNFNYRINIGAGVFLLVGSITLIIALVTVGLNASAAALRNPGKTLRSE
ncbi:ABC transporter permease [Terrimonas sp. NA20]|uniref:ABC transporter permease n=1 Tax=Terrimonas ginsenosidimutans TaxID=2908004 RepID=A0ABS9KXT4_9BACT|nr:ABC transporter permease [Terrimonas ginsenosidimutans]MCG2617157.1 ABC transporter permease [Terrimonas ginsenosidimutans]